MTSTQIHRLYLLLNELHHDAICRINVTLDDTPPMTLIFQHLDDEYVSFNLVGYFKGRKRTMPYCITFSEMKTWNIDDSNGLLYGWLKYIQKNTVDNCGEPLC